MRQYHAAPIPKKIPYSVLCSWQYYGPNLTQADLTEDLAALERDGVPLNVYLIDDGWQQEWGDWYTNAERFPDGMATAGKLIQSYGLRAGIWTCPFLFHPESKLAQEHPEWAIMLDDGDKHIFSMVGVSHWVLDPTIPAVCNHIETLYRRLSDEYGFAYHKLDFLRSVSHHIAFDKPNASLLLADPTRTRLEAYELGLGAVRRGIGVDGYLAVCGGHYGASLGIADSQRSGSDVAGVWDKPPALPRIKQNFLRTWMRGLWHTDPDAMMVRRQEKELYGGAHAHLSLGKFTDAEAQTITINQYLGGGLMCFGEKWSVLDQDRKDLYRHVIPALGMPGTPTNYYEPSCPTELYTHIEPLCEGLSPWITLAVFNWQDEAAKKPIVLSAKYLDKLKQREAGGARRFLISEFFTQTVLGVYGEGDEVTMPKHEAHGPRLLRICLWDGVTPTLAGTDLHFSGGGVEIDQWSASVGNVTGRVNTQWPGEVSLMVCVPKDGGIHTQRIQVTEQRLFDINI